MREREVVHVRDVPEGEVRGPEREGDARPEERAEHAAHARVACERGEHRGGEEEDEERPAHREDHERRADVADEDVLGHVRREELLVGEPVKRPDEREQRHADPEREQRDAIPAGEIGAPAAAKPHNALREEKRRDSGGDGITAIVPRPRPEASPQRTAQALRSPGAPKAPPRRVLRTRRGRPRSPAPEFLAASESQLAS